MRIAIKTWLGYLSLQPDGSLQFRDEVGPWETWDLQNLDPTPVPPPTPGTWPPTAPPWPPQPANIATTDEALVLERVQWWLWHTNSSDDQTYWMRVILLDPEPGHAPGWTADDYWSLKISAGDGVGEGYVWPPK